MAFIFIVGIISSLTVGVCPSSEALLSDVSPRENIESWSSVTIVVAICSIVCALVILIMCADFCPRRQNFKDFENPDTFFGDVAIGQPPVVDFAMYPPVESSAPASASSSAVYFEPLPDIAAAARLRQRKQSNIAPNVARLRPKIYVAGRDTLDSDSSDCDIVDGEIARRRELAQEKIKLDRLLAGIQRVNAKQQFPRSQLQYIREVGSSWFGKVLQGEGNGILPGHKKTKVIIQMLNEEADQHDQYAFLQEASCYRLVDSPNVLKLLAQCVESAPFLTILEFCSLGDLKSYLRSQRLSVESLDRQGVLLNVCCDMAAGLQALHQNSFIHRDFAIRNCLIGLDMTVKIGDYGLSEETYRDDYMIDSNGDALPIRWLAPESMHCLDSSIVILRNITRESNLWSFGVALWEVFTCGAMPYGDLTNDQVLRLVVEEGVVRPSRPDLPVSNIDRLYQLMQMCWNPLPGQRASLRELRIMLLHLRSASQGEPDTTAFDLKWNQLMPRRLPPADFAGSSRLGTGLGDFTGSNVHTVSADVIDVDLGTFASQRQTNFDSDFSSELNASMLAHPGSLQPSVKSLSFSPDSTARTTYDSVSPDTSINRGNGAAAAAVAAASPVNEMSLAAELGMFGTTFGGITSDSEDDGVGGDLAGPNASFSRQQEMSRGGSTPQRLSVHAEVHNSGENNAYATKYIGDEDSPVADDASRRLESKESNGTLASEPECIGDLAHEMSEDLFSDSHNTRSVLQSRNYAAYLQTVSTSIVEGDDDFSVGGSGEQVHREKLPAVSAEIPPRDAGEFDQYYTRLAADTGEVMDGEKFLGDNTEFALYYKARTEDVLNDSSGGNSDVTNM